MKKFLSTVLFLIMTAPCFAIENNSVLNLKTDNSYIIPLKSRAHNLQVSNSRIVNVSSVTGINDEDSSLLVTTMEEGISYITFKQKDVEVTLKLLIDNKAEADKDLLILDKPNGEKK